MLASFVVSLNSLDNDFFQPFTLHQQLANDVRLFNARQLLIEPLKLECEAIVLDAHSMQDRHVEVADRGRLIDDVVRNIVGLTTQISPKRHPPAPLAMATSPQIDCHSPSLRRHYEKRPRKGFSHRCDYEMLPHRRS